MANYKFILWKHQPNKEGALPVYLRITKERRSKYIGLNLFALPEQFDEKSCRFVTDKRSKGYSPDNAKHNAFLSKQETEIADIWFDFDRQKIDWTLNQFEDAFLNKSKKGKVKPYFEALISSLQKTGRIGNALCYANTIRMLELYDKSFAKRVFSEIDLKYVRGFDEWMQIPRQTTYISTNGNAKIVNRDGCSGNTRKYYMKALRAILNKAIQEKEASANTYPFGKGRFEIAELEKETAKRFLPNEYLLKIKNTESIFPHVEFARKLFLFSYFCYGMSFVDMALLTDKNITRLDGGSYIVYIRHKIRNSKKAKAIQIKITDEIRGLICDLQEMKQPVDKYLLPIVTKESYSGEQLYNHVRTRYSRYNKNLAVLATEFGMQDINLTTYVSRHTMAMTLQGNDIPREVISQILGHKDLKTTNTYLDQLDNSVIDEAVKVL